MPLWVDDFLRGTKLMELEELGLYIKIILELWVDGKLPSDQKKLAKILGINPRSFARIFPLIQGKFVVDSEFISHSRVDEERLKLISKSEKNRINGKKGGKAKANATNSLDPKAGHTDTDTNTDIDTDKKKKEKENIRSVFDHYLKVFGKSEKSYKFTKTKQAVIKQGLDADYSVDDLKKAIEAMKADTWEGRKDSNDIKYAVRVTSKNDAPCMWLGRNGEKTDKYPAPPKEDWPHDAVDWDGEEGDYIYSHEGRS